MVGSWQFSRVGVTLREKWAVNTFFVLFPPYFGFGRRGWFHFSINDTEEIGLHSVIRMCLVKAGRCFYL